MKPTCIDCGKSLTMKAAFICEDCARTHIPPHLDSLLHPELEDDRATKSEESRPRMSDPAELNEETHEEWEAMRRGEAPQATPAIPVGSEAAREVDTDWPTDEQGRVFPPLDDGSCSGDCTATTAPDDYVACGRCGAACGHGYCAPCQGTGQERVISATDLRTWIEVERIARNDLGQRASEGLLDRLSAFVDEQTGEGKP